MIVRLIRAIWRQLGPGPGPWDETVSADMSAEQAQWEKRFERGSPDFCGGLFHRPLSGFVISRDEMDGLLATPGELDAVLARLDPTLSHDLLVAGVIHLLREPPLTQDAQAAFKAAARAAAELHDGSIWQMRLGGFYADWLEAASLSQRIALLEKTDHYRMPVAGALLGYALLEAARQASDAHAAATTIARARECLQTAANYGDRQAEFDLARIDADGMLQLAEDRIARHQDYAGAIELFRRAAADPRWFRFDVAQAQYRLAMLLRDGEHTPRDPAEAQRWLQSAAKLGNPHARAFLQKMQ